MTAVNDTEYEYLDVLVVCPELGMENILTKIRKWNTEKKTLFNKWHIKSSIKKSFDLPSALNTVNHNIDHSILVPIGYKERDVQLSMNQQEQENLEVIIRPPRRGATSELNDFPSSSLLSRQHLINVQDTLPALQKTFLKKYFQKRVIIKPLESQEEFQQYFHLRYKVWKDMGYLKTERDSGATQWELDYTDRTALPIGVFNSKRKLIACARLVFSSGMENYHVALIEDMIKQSRDKILAANFARPRFLTHPFDVLESFRGFNDYYAKLIKKRLRVAEVSRVVVDKAYRQSGLGEVLVDSLITMAERDHLDLLFLACQAAHKRFYQRCGFTMLDGIESDHFVNMEVKSIAMIRDLNKTISEHKSSTH